MSLLTRPDGVQFVVQPYRERIAIGKRSVMAQRIRFLADQHGPYVLLAPLIPGAIEAIFSRESGYLLGESIWTYFDKPPYLIFCERLSKDNNQVLLIIIRANEIYLDALVDNDKLRSELLPLMTMHESFRVITSGEVSLGQKEDTNHFELPKNLVTSFEIAKEPVFKSLPVYKQVRLLTLPIALKSPLLGHRISPAILGGGIAVILAVIWWIYYVYPAERQAVSLPQLVAQLPDEAYASFYTAMKTPAPEQQLIELARITQSFYSLPGWQAGEIRYDDGQYRVKLIRQGGTLNWLNHWVYQHHYLLNLHAEDAEVAVPSQLTPRSTPKAMYSISEIMASLVDNLDRMFMNQNISISEPRIFGMTKLRTLTINLTDATPDTLLLIGKTVGGLPLSVTGMNVSLRSGLLYGSVQLSVWGI
jgi:hypothetical protein